MSDLLVKTTGTRITLDAFTAAVVRAWRLREGSLPSMASVGVLWAQYALETGGGSHCYNDNLGNVKHVRGDGFDYCELQGVWEGMTPSALAAAQAGPLGHLVRLDPSLDHQGAVGPGRVSAVFDPPHPATWFRSYPSLTVAMTEHLDLLEKRRYAGAWPAVVAGDVPLFAKKLKERGYYTSSEASYARGMQGWYDRYVASGAYPRALSAIEAEAAADTEPSLPVTPEQDESDRVGPILHPDVPLPSYRDEDREPDSGVPDSDVMVQGVLSKLVKPRGGV